MKNYNYYERISLCCNSKMIYKYNDYDSNYVCLKCNRARYFVWRHKLAQWVIEKFNLYNQKYK